MLRKKQLALYLAIASCSFCHIASAAPDERTAPVTGFARSFLMDQPIANAHITVLETSQQLVTNDKGRFAINYPVGKPITLLFKKWGYKTTQSGTMIVPPEGLTGPYKNVTFQIPSIETYYLFSFIIGAKINPDSCHLTTTILAHNKTLDDIPQGEVDAKITLYPQVNVTPFYFDIFDSGPFKGKTNPFTKGLTAASKDGGVAFFNLPPSEKPYTISAIKAGMQFSQAQFLCRKGMFINISPPRGPMADK